jgi:hypothetical protein
LGPDRQTQLTCATSLHRHAISIRALSTRRIFDAPLRFFRYITLPGREAAARYEALSEDEKAERRAWSNKLYWAYAAFPSPFARKRPK